MRNQNKQYTRHVSWRVLCYIPAFLLRKGGIRRNELLYGEQLGVNSVNIRLAAKKEIESIAALYVSNRKSIYRWLIRDEYLNNPTVASAVSICKNISDKVRVVFIELFQNSLYKCDIIYYNKLCTMC